MTVQELSQLYWLTKEIEADQQRLDQLRAEAGAISSPGVNGMPGGGGNRHGKVEQAACAIVDLENHIAEKKMRCIVERDRLLQYISTIPNSLTRQVFQLRFMDGLSWADVAKNIGGGNTEAGLKKLCYRYLKKERATP